MRIFVSYSSRNRPQVKALVQDLENTGHDVWYDQEAAGGHEWWADILENIRACELFIFALTPESLDSEACRREYRYAHALHKRILPVRLNKVVNPASLTVELQKINFVDYFSGVEQEYRQLVRAITSLKPPAPMPDPMPDEPPVPISPLGELREKIAARSIGVETQTYLVFELKQHVEKAATQAEALELLQRLQNHPSVLAKVANEITSIITPYVRRKADTGNSGRAMPPRRVMAAGLVGLVAIAVVIGLVIVLSSGGDEGNKDKQTDTGDRTEVASDLTDTPTPTNEASATNTTVATPSPTDELTATSTQTSTATNTPSPTDTPYSTPSATNTTVATPSPTDEPTATSTQTSTATNTPSPTDTPSSTPSATNAISPTLPPGFEKVTSNAQWREMGGPIEQEFDGVMMVLVPAGCFDMGSTQEQREYSESLGVAMQYTEDETPVTEICFDEPFWIDKYEVTNEQYGSVGCLSKSSEPDQPYNCISWIYARAFCEEKRGGRLPTEAEWEYAARGPDELIFPWGDEFNADNVVYWNNSNTQTAEVGSKVGGASWVGAYDLSGNVWEWVSSIYLPYDSAQDREDNSSYYDKNVVRGGSFNSNNYGLRAAGRFDRSSVDNFDDYGFRCARSIQ